MIKINNLSFRYNKNSSYVIKDVNLITPANKISILLGNNGVGKTTLFKCISGILKFYEGRVLVNGLNVDTTSNKEISKKLAYVFQINNESNLSVYETILLGRTPYINFYPTKKDHEIVSSLIKEFNLEKYSSYSFSYLSGGYKQKVMIARALASGAETFLFDEISSNLDISNKVFVFNLIKELKKKGKTIFIALHDLNDALYLGDYFYLLKDGKIIAEGNKNIINKKNILEAYNIDVDIKKLGGEDYVIYKKSS